MFGLNFAWHWSPFTIGFLIILCLLYGFGIRWARKNNAYDTPLATSRVVAFIGAIIGMVLVLLTPIDTIARTQLFAAHMLQAVVLTTLCAPLLLFACPTWLLQPLLKLPVVRGVASVLTNAIVASIIFNGTFLIWHAPVVYNYALMHGTLYHVEMLTIFITALLNWWPLIGPVRELRRLSYPLQMLYVFLDGQFLDIFAFLLVFSGVVFYTHYVVPPQLGIPAFADQAVGGAFLLLPGLVDLVVMTPLFFRWLGQIEQRAQIEDQRRQEEMELAALEVEEEMNEEVGETFPIRKDST